VPSWEARLRRGRAALLVAAHAAAAVGAAAFLAAAFLAAAAHAAAGLAAAGLATATGLTAAALAAALLLPIAARHSRSSFSRVSWKRDFPFRSTRETLSTLENVEPLRDSWGRDIKSVRVSVTDKCNFRCTYCMPAEGLEWLGRDEILTFEEIARLVGILARLGVDEVRLTGGEPLVRRDLPVLVGMLAANEGIRDLSLTTNGVLLDRLAAPLVEAGLRRINVSLDTP